MNGDIYMKYQKAQTLLILFHLVSLTFFLAFCDVSHNSLEYYLTEAYLHIPYSITVPERQKLDLSGKSKYKRWLICKIKMRHKKIKHMLQLLPSNWMWKLTMTLVLNHWLVLKELFLVKCLAKDFQVLRAGKSYRVKISPALILMKNSCRWMGCHRLFHRQY